MVRECAEQATPRQDADDTAIIYDWEVLLEAIEDARDRLRDAVRQRKRVEIANHRVADGDAGEGRLHAHQARLLIGAHPHEQCDEHQKRLYMMPTNPRSGAIACPTCAAIYVART